MNTISDTTSNNREDAYILVNGTSVVNMLTQTNTSGFNYRSGSIVVKLSANDYVTFDSTQWRNATNTAYYSWRTVSVTKVG